MKGRMLFIFNPRSGKGQIRNKLMDIIDVFVKGGYEVVVHPTQGAKDAEKMAKSMAEEVDLIVCSGGDGTLDEVVTGLMEIGANVPWNCSDWLYSGGKYKRFCKQPRDPAGYGESSAGYCGRPSVFCGCGKL